MLSTQLERIYHYLFRQICLIYIWLSAPFVHWNEKKIVIVRYCIITDYSSGAPDGLCDYKFIDLNSFDTLIKSNSRKL